jgi:hypothetical protein
MDVLLIKISNDNGCFTYQNLKWQWMFYLSKSQMTMDVLLIKISNDNGSFTYQNLKWQWMFYLLRNVFFPHCQDFYRDWQYIWVTRRVFYKKQELRILVGGPYYSSFTFFVLSYYVSLRPQFRVVMSVTISIWKRCSVRL